MPNSCRVDGCNRESSAKGYCPAHYQRILISGDPGPAEIRPRSANRDGPCRVADCPDPIYARGFCLTHWRHWRINGDPVLGPIDRRPNSKFRGVARRLKAKGMTYAEIGDVLGVSRQRVQQLVGLTAAERKFWFTELGGECHFCENGAGKLDLHHLEYSDGEMKVVLLCGSCHRKLEGLRLAIAETE